MISQLRQRNYEESILDTEALDKIKTEYRPFIQDRISTYWLDGNTCSLTAIALAIRMPYGLVRHAAVESKIQIGGGVNDKQLLTLIRKLKVQHKSYYVNKSWKKSVELLYSLPSRAVLTLGDQTQDQSCYSWSHCVAWDPKLKRFLDWTYGGVRVERATANLQNIYQLQHVVECKDFTS